MKNSLCQFIDSLNEVQQDFVWNKSRPKIKHSGFIGNYEEGGYKDVDIPKDVDISTAEKSLEQCLGKSEIDWEEVYLTPLKITIKSQLRVFQYKILNNILYLNNRLFKMGYADSP